MMTSERSAIQEVLALMSKPGILSLALGLPAAELFPTADYGAALTHVLDKDPRALQYEAPIQRLKQQIVALMRLRGVTCSEAQVVLTAGAQQGMSLLARLLLDPGAVVLVEERTYSGFLQAIAPLQPRFVTVPSDLDSGMDVDAVARLLDGPERPRLIYAMSDGHNPLGTSLSRDRRHRLVELARTYGVPIVEDDAYGFLSYDADRLPPLRALDERWVLYVGSFSKILAPAVRAGWLIVPEPLAAPLSVIKESSDIDTTTLGQRGVSAFLGHGGLEQHLSLLRREYRARRDALLAALQEYFPPGARWTRPEAGMFVWVELPGPVDTMRLFERAIADEQVAFLPGQAFWVPGGPRQKNGLRLNFSHCAPSRIEEGVRRIARALATISA